MNTISTIRTLLQGALLAAFIPALSLPALAAMAGGTTANTGTHPPAATVAKGGPVHSGQTMPAALRPVFYQALAKDAGATYNLNKNGCAKLSKQTLKGCFDADGAHFSGTTPLALRLISYGRGSNLSSVPSVQPTINDNQASYVHNNITEWWRVLPIGFEQGFTIAKRPSGNGELTLALAMSRQDAGAPTVRHSRASGNPVQASPSNPLRSEGGKEIAWGKLRYGQLVVTDAKGKGVPATLTSKGNRILIAVNDAHAVYPLTVDPLVWLEQQVVASDGAPDDNFGFSVALAGTTAFVGASNATVNGNSLQGAVYVFTNSNGEWTQTAKLIASDGAGGDYFGDSVALAGTTALVSAPGHNGNQGVAYVFSESGGSWTQTAELLASDGVAGDEFGDSVALWGAIALVGAPYATVNGNQYQGAAYVFVGSDGNWTQQAKLTASDGATWDFLGYSVAIQGTTALVGAPQCDGFGECLGGAGAAYVFIGDDGTWTEMWKLTTSDGAANDAFGWSVALDQAGDALIGALQLFSGGPGAAYVFAGALTQTQKLTASDGVVDGEFGFAVALDGTTAVVGANQYAIGGSGAAYVFDGSTGTWTQTRKLTASDGAADDSFGQSVALAGTTALISAPGATVNGNSVQGAAYFEDSADLDLLTTAPAKVYRYSNYLTQAIATNDSTVASPAVAVTVAVPAAASFVSATSTQGTCGENAGVVTCNFGQIGQGGFASANVTLEAIGNGGSTIENTASFKGTPKLTDTAPTLIHPCAADYLEYSGTLAPNARYRTPAYQSAAGKQTVLFSAPQDFALRVGYQKNAQSQWEIREVSRHALYHYGPAGAYRWQINAGNDGGAYTLCILHP